MTLPMTDDPAADLSHMLNRLLRITIPDERYFIGRFICVDHQLNIVLIQAEEFRPDPKTEEERENQDKVDKYMPKSQRGAGEGDGWGVYAKYDEADGLGRGLKEGRMLGMILITAKDVVEIDMIEEAPGRGGAGSRRMAMMGDIM